MLLKLVHLQNMHFLLTPSSVHVKCVFHNPLHPTERTQPWRTATLQIPSLWPIPGIWTGTLPCRSAAQTGCTAVPTQPTKKIFLCMTGTTINHCINSSQGNFKFYLNSWTASLPYINFTLYYAISPILRDHQYFRTVNQYVWFYFKQYLPNSRTTFKTASYFKFDIYCFLVVVHTPSPPQQPWDTHDIPTLAHFTRTIIQPSLNPRKLNAFMCKWNKNAIKLFWLQLLGSNKMRGKPLVKLRKYRERFSLFTVSLEYGISQGIFHRPWCQWPKFSSCHVQRDLKMQNLFSSTRG